MGMHAHATARFRPIFGAFLTPTRRDRRALAGFLLGLLVIGSLAYAAGNGFFHDFRFAAPSPDGPGDGNRPMAARDPLLWPFTRDSIWNLPIGADAVYVHADIKRATAGQVMQPDVDVLILTPDAPLTPVYYNDDAWSTIPGRCDAEGGEQFSAPIPRDFVVLGNGMGSPHGNTPNYATAILAQDGVTLYQGQPFARCSVDGTATIWWYQTAERLDGRGHSGAHGGSMLSSIGGTIRLGELVPGGTIPHALKLNLNGDNYYSGLGSFRWPATTRDSCAPGCYTGSVPEMRMGSLVALKPDFDLSGLETDPARIVARAFMDYGGYAADNAGWSVYGIDTEYSPSGDVMVEFQDLWGFSMEAPQDSPWARDMHAIFGALHVVDNWNVDLYDKVAASNGTLGVGDGAPRVSWAPDFGSPPNPDPDSTPPSTTSDLAGTAGASDWFRSPVTITLSATDSGSGVASIHLRVDGGSWDVYSAPVTVSPEGRHTIEYYAKDVAGNEGVIQTVAFGIDTIAPSTTSALSGTLGGDGWYRSPVVVTLASTDATSGVAGLQVRSDGGSWAPYSAPFTVSGDGTHTVEYQANDAAGNVETIASTTFKIDTLAPITTYALAGTLSTSGWYVSSVNVTLSASSSGGGPASVAYQLNGGPWATYSGPFTVEEGRHVLQYQATDAQGNVEPLQSVPISVDSTPPTIGRSGTDPIHPDTDLTWIGFDSTSGIARYEVSIDGGSFVPLGTEARLAGPWSAGPHTAVVRAYDVAGNVATQSFGFDVDPDAPAPVSQPILTIPFIPFNVSQSFALLAVIVLLVLAAVALVVRRARNDRRASRSRVNSESSWRGTSDDLSDDADLPL